MEALDETAKITKPTKIAKMTKLSSDHRRKINGNRNEAIEAKNYENNGCGYTSHFTNGQMAIAHGEAAFCVCPVSRRWICLGEIFTDTSEEQQNRPTLIDQNSHLATRLRGIKQKKCILHYWLNFTMISFVVFPRSKPRSAASCNLILPR